MVSEAGEYSRLLRPYSSRRLTHALYQVEATAASITQAKLRLLIDPPFDAAEWQFELETLQGMLETLAEQAELAHTRLGLMWSSAPGDYERGLRAATRLLQGISAVTTKQEVPQC
jgi:hypothetical protein